MTYTINVNSENPIMLIDKHIGFDSEEGVGIDGSLFQKELMELDNMGKKSIQVWINCPGGSVVEGYKIFNAILKSKTPVDTYNMGIAASMGGVVFMAGRNRKMADYALMMIHSPSGGDDEDVIEAMSGSLAKMISAKSNTSEHDISAMMRKTSWLTASDCMMKGFCTEIEATRRANVKQVPDAKAMWKTCTTIVNSILQTPNNTKNTVMTKVTMKLGLVEAASEDQILEAIKNITDKAYTAETKLIQIEGENARKLKEITDKAVADVTAAKNDLKTATEAAEKAENDVVSVKALLTKAQADLKAVTDKLTVLEAEKTAAEELQKETAAKSLVDSHVKTGRIKNEVKIIERYVNMAKDDFEGTKLLIESIPLSVKAPVFQTELRTEGIPEGMGTSATALAVRNKLKREGKLN